MVEQLPDSTPWGYLRSRYGEIVAGLPRGSGSGPTQLMPVGSPQSRAAADFRRELLIHCRVGDEDSGEKGEGDDEGQRDFHVR